MRHRRRIKKHYLPCVSGHLPCRLGEAVAKPSEAGGVGPHQILDHMNTLVAERLGSLARGPGALWSETVFVVGCAVCWIGSTGPVYLLLIVWRVLTRH